jgi:pimeloyl-ACP methyl ester carboxylesterase
VKRIRNGRVEIVLHQRRAGQGAALLLLHALGGSSADWGAEVDGWPGPVFALDFAGHGDSGRLRGGSYDIETLLSDADLALKEIGAAAVAGAGLGAWYAVILAGTRAERVPACLLAPGAGLAGAGPEPDPRDMRPRLPTEAEARAFTGSADPYVLAMDREPRPPWFVEPFARAAATVLLVEDGGERPPWWEAVRACGAEPAGADLAAGLAALARVVAQGREGRERPEGR